MGRVEVEPVRVGVDLDHRARLRGSRDHRVEVDRVAVAGQQQPARSGARASSPADSTTARTIRAVISARGMPKLEWTLATT